MPRNWDPNAAARQLHIQQSMPWVQASHDRLQLALAAAVVPHKAQAAPFDCPPPPPGLDPDGRFITDHAGAASSPEEYSESKEPQTDNTRIRSGTSESSIVPQPLAIRQRGNSRGQSSRPSKDALPISDPVSIEKQNLQEFRKPSYMAPLLSYLNPTPTGSAVPNFLRPDDQHMEYFRRGLLTTFLGWLSTDPKPNIVEIDAISFYPISANPSQPDASILGERPQNMKTLSFGSGLLKEAISWEVNVPTHVSAPQLLPSHTPWAEHQSYTISAKSVPGFDPKTLLPTSRAPNLPPGVAHTRSNQKYSFPPSQYLGGRWLVIVLVERPGSGAIGDSERARRVLNPDPPTPHAFPAPTPAPAPSRGLGGVTVDNMLRNPSNPLTRAKSIADRPSVTSAPSSSQPPSQPQTNSPPKPRDSVPWHLIALPVSTITSRSTSTTSPPQPSPTPPPTSASSSTAKPLPSTAHEKFKSRQRRHKKRNSTLNPSTTTTASDVAAGSSEVEPEAEVEEKVQVKTVTHLRIDTKGRLPLFEGCGVKEGWWQGWMETCGTGEVGVGWWEVGGKKRKVS
ncbi:MAG: hypothetical protein M1820_009561 [Bogoriella megaspora]|nr:MAG: hypothetical protein M1820_009561 [Bogoriella megaspora]